MQRCMSDVCASWKVQNGRDDEQKNGPVSARQHNDSTDFINLATHDYMSVSVRLEPVHDTAHFDLEHMDESQTDLRLTKERGLTPCSSTKRLIGRTLSPCSDSLFDRAATA